MTPGPAENAIPCSLVVPLLKHISSFFSHYKKAVFRPNHLIFFGTLPISSIGTVSLLALVYTVICCLVNMSRFVFLYVNDCRNAIFFPFGMCFKSLLS